MAGTRMRSFLSSSRGGSNSSVEKREEQSVSRLIARQEWGVLRDLLSPEKGGEGLCDVEKDSEQTTENMLHYACRFHPPYDVVKLLFKAYPESASHVDNMGRFPLHLAAKWGASPKVIKFLIDRNPSCAGAQDVMGKTPLHLVCENYVQKYNAKKEGAALKDSMLEVVRTICRAAPSSVNLEDMDDMSALEYAIDSNTDLKVVKDLQKACEKDWRKRRTISGDSHRNLEKGMQEQFQDRKAQLRQDIIDMTSATVAMNISASNAKQNGVVDNKPTPRPGLTVLEPRRKKTSARALTA